MTERIQISAQSPEGYRKVNGLDAYVTSNLDTELVNFIYLRASLINGCTYCVDAHSVDLAEGGTDPRRIYSVRTWKESSFYSERERAAFALTEAITLIAGTDGVDDATWDAAAAVFKERRKRRPVAFEPTQCQSGIDISQFGTVPVEQFPCRFE